MSGRRFLCPLVFLEAQLAMPSLVLVPLRRAGPHRQIPKLATRFFDIQELGHFSLCPGPVILGAAARGRGTMLPVSRNPGPSC